MSNLGYADGAQLNSWLPAFGFALTFSESYLLGGMLLMIPLGLIFTFNPDAVE